MGPVVTDDEVWADLGRRIQAFEADLVDLGCDVTIRFDRPHGRVDIIIRPA
jgi:hypothetical protein